MILSENNKIILSALQPGDTAGRFNGNTAEDYDDAKMNKGILTVVSGFSGAGKGTIMKALMQAHSETYALSISCDDARTANRGARRYRVFFQEPRSV